MLDEKTRALLGDREAQEAFTARGGAVAVSWVQWRRNEARRIWNQRAPLLTPTQMEVLERETGKVEEGIK